MKKFTTASNAYVKANKEVFSDPSSQVTVTTLLHVAEALDNDLSAALVTQYRYLLQTLEATRLEAAPESADPDALPPEFGPRF